MLSAGLAHLSLFCNILHQQTEKTHKLTILLCREANSQPTKPAPSKPWEGACELRVGSQWGVRSSGKESRLCQSGCTHMGGSQCAESQGKGSRTDRTSDGAAGAPPRTAPRALPFPETSHHQLENLRRGLWLAGRRKQNQRRCRGPLVTWSQVN